MRLSKKTLGPWMDLTKKTLISYVGHCKHALYDRHTFVRKSLLWHNIEALTLLNSWTFSNFPLRKTLKQTIKFKYEPKTHRNWHENKKSTDVFLIAKKNKTAGYYRHILRLSNLVKMQFWKMKKFFLEINTFFIIFSNFSNVRSFLFFFCCQKHHNEGGKDIYNK